MSVRSLGVAWEVVAQATSSGHIKLLPGLKATCRLDWGWQVCSQDSSRVWLLVGFLSFSVAVGRRLSFLATGASPQGCVMFPRDMAVDPSQIFTDTDVFYHLYNALLFYALVAF